MANLTPFFSKGLGKRPSVDSSTVLSPVSGSAGLRSSVFLSLSCATALPSIAVQSKNARRQRRIDPTAPELSAYVAVSASRNNISEFAVAVPGVADLAQFEQVAPFAFPS